MNNKKVKFGVLVITLAFLIPLTSAAVTYLMRATVGDTVAVPDIQFMSGDDTLAIGGTIGSNGSVFTADALPLVAGTQVTVDQAVTVNNTSGSAKMVQLGLHDTTIGAECKAITVYINGVIAVQINDAGTVTTTISGYFSLANSATVGWIVKIVTEMDPDAAATAETLELELTWY